MDNVFEQLRPEVEPLTGVDYWIGIAGQLTTEIKRLEREKTALTIALVQAAGGRIEVSNFDLMDLSQMEVLVKKQFDRDSTLYLTRRRRS